MTDKKVTPFDYINDIGFGKNSLFSRLDGEGYNQFMINRGFGQHIDTVIVANEMNKRYNISDLMHHDFLLHSIPAKKRFGKWASASNKSEMVDFIREHMNVNREVATGYLEIIGEEPVKELMKSLKNKGGRK